MGGVGRASLAARGSRNARQCAGGASARKRCPMGEFGAAKSTLILEKKKRKETKTSRSSSHWNVVFTGERYVGLQMQANFLEYDLDLATSNEFLVRSIKSTTAVIQQHAANSDVRRVRRADAGPFASVTYFLALSVQKA
ncbi:hypothetical protein EVAR_84781_1 [Eumeta japonica]|uniref:Uncharacterized protein n=1 Tax=Eumeta variegata TaxID=151549 RepID=A0A4C1U7Z8_EUMVA|nr:hypothetical protein EVAR_84781_1 [Eumeta japonica]